MSLSIGGNLSINTYGAQSAQNATAGQNARPNYVHNQTWNSIGEMSQAWSKLTKDWANYYSGAFAASGANGDGKISQEELSGLLQQEFGGMGVKFTDSAVDENNPKAGTFEVFIDNKTRAKMANDPEYRAKVMAVIQSEMAGTKGYSLKTEAGVRTDRTTGLSMNMIEGGPLYEGVPHSAGGTSADGGVVAFSKESGGESKSLLEKILEKLAEKRAEAKEAEKKEAAKKAREDLVEISVEAKAALNNRSVEDAAKAEKTDDDESQKTGGLNVLA